MKCVDLIVLGAGLAGTAIAWQAHFRGWSVALIDRLDPQTSSLVAAGLVTPVTGSRGAASWRWDEFYPIAENFYLRIEQTTGKCLLQQTWRFGVDRWPVSALLRLPLSPLLSLSAVTVMDGTGNRVAQILANFPINATSVPPTIQAKTVPSSGAVCEGGIQLDAVFGYGTTAASVPQPLRLAVLMVAAQFYETRGQGETILPGAVRTLIAPFVGRAL